MTERQADSSLPRFTNLAGFQGFNIRKSSSNLRQRAYPGMAVASAGVLYFVVDEKRLSENSAALGGAAGGAAAGGVVGGLVGGLVAGLAGDLIGRSGKKRLLSMDVPLVEEKDLADLPMDVTRHPEWPVTWEEGRVLVVPRRAVRSVRTTFWVGGIDVHLEGVCVRIFTPVFRRKRMAAHLVELGWDVEGV